MIILLRFAFFAALIALWVWSILDVIRTAPEDVRYVHKLVWLALVVLLNPVGAIAWLVVGRPETIGSRFIPRTHPSVRAPDDSPEYLARLDEEIKRRRRAEQLRRSEIDPQDVDDEISRLEDEFRKSEEEDPPPTS